MRKKRILIGIGIALGALVLAAALLYAFGGMWPPSDAVRAEYAAMVARGQANPIEARFTIPIPGCVCHSDDPVLQMQHSGRRMSECRNCHARG